MADSRADDATADVAAEAVNGTGENGASENGAGENGTGEEPSNVVYGLHRVIITVTLVSASLLELIDTTVVNVSVPVIRGNLGATVSQMSWVIAGYAMANAIVVPITGWLSSFFGRRRYFITSILAFTAASFMCGHAGGIWSLVFWRFGQGLAGGALLATSQATLVEVYPEDQVGFANAMFGIGAVVGPTVGPVLGGWLTTSYTWPWIFYVNLPVGICAAILSYIYVPEPVEKMATGKLDWQGLLFLIVGIGALQILLERGADEDWFETTYITVCAVLAVVGVLAFVWWELREAEDPVVDLTVLKNRATALGTVFIFVLGIGLYSILFFYPQFVQALLGFSAYQTGISLLPGGLAALLAMPFIGLLLQKGFSVRLMAGMGFTLFFVCCWMLSRETLASGGVFYGDFFWPQVWRGLGTAMLFVPLTTIMYTGLKGAAIAQASGLNNMARQLGGSFGLALGATFIDFRSGVYAHRVGEDVTRYDFATQLRLEQITQALMARGSYALEATQQAYAALQGTVMQNVLQMTYADAFFWIGVFALACVPFLLLIPKVKGGPQMGH